MQQPFAPWSGRIAGQGGSPEIARAFRRGLRGWAGREPRFHERHRCDTGVMLRQVQPPQIATPWFGLDCPVGGKERGRVPGKVGILAVTAVDPSLDRGNYAFETLLIVPGAP